MIDFTEFSIWGTIHEEGAVSHTCGYTSYIDNLQQAIVWAQEHLEKGCPNVDSKTATNEP